MPVLGAQLPFSSLAECSFSVTQHFSPYAFDEFYWAS